MLSNLILLKRKRDLFFMTSSRKDISKKSLGELNALGSKREEFDASRSEAEESGAETEREANNIQRKKELRSLKNKQGKEQYEARRLIDRHITSVDRLQGLWQSRFGPLSGTYNEVYKEYSQTKSEMKQEGLYDIEKQEKLGRKKSDAEVPETRKRKQLDVKEPKVRRKKKSDAEVPEARRRENSEDSPQEKISESELELGSNAGVAFQGQEEKNAKREIRRVKSPGPGHREHDMPVLKTGKRQIIDPTWLADTGKIDQEGQVRSDNYTLYGSTVKVRNRKANLLKGGYAGGWELVDERGKAQRAEYLRVRAQKPSQKNMKPEDMEGEIDEEQIIE